MTPIDRAAGAILALTGETEETAHLDDVEQAWDHARAALESLDVEDLARAMFLSDRASTQRPGFAEEQWDEGHVGEVRDAYIRRAQAVVDHLSGKETS